ncbi:hypothetical protein Tco_0941084 [Tanacetum coccineum]|uniref:Uncharacterized protein n=1 Tax=Tanacetum coccineum TaxID=301880 RepID=A0ABQ5DVU7_9ASTR
MDPVMQCTTLPRHLESLKEFCSISHGDKTRYLLTFSLRDTYPILLSFTHCGNKSFLRVLRIILVILPEHPSETIVVHNEDGNPARANIKLALGYLKDGDGDGNSHAQDGDPSQDDVRLCLDDDLKKAQDHSQRQDIPQLMQGTSLTKQEQECKLYDEFDKFTYKKGESLHEYYLRFTLLLNDMNIYKMPLEQFQVNTKFLNTLPAEWSKFITDVKLVKDLHTTNVDQIHAHLEQHERHANEV